MNFARLCRLLPVIFALVVAPGMAANESTTTNLQEEVRLWAVSLPAQLVVGWLIASGASVAGLYGSYQLDLPTGAAVVCALGLSLVLAAAVRLLTRRTAHQGLS